MADHLEPVIYVVNSTSLDNLKRDFEARGVFEGIPDDEDPELADIDIRGTLNSSELTDAQLCKLHTDGCVAFALCLLIRLKFALKDMYGLDDERCQTYRPTNAAASVRAHQLSCAIADHELTFSCIVIAGLSTGCWRDYYRP